jgi:hypothetical protein
MTEGRSTPRRRVLKGAIAAFNARHSTIPCTVRDISDTGCRLLISGAVAIPDTFELIVEIDGLVAPCEVVRRTNTEIGVRFTGPVERRAPLRAQIVQAIGPAAAPTLRSKRPKPS